MAENSSKTGTFDYQLAFSRNIGWVTEAEQQRLRSCRVAVGGLGGGCSICGIAAGAANANDGNAKQCDAARAAQHSRSPDSVGR